ncbi:Glutathione gamma-glutamylcysteinyltransferase [Seminavis robusta]|uniref:glutathione gamma-glutamylcysteinyltransferase n=1 Tax=Seminavis robusta TaxID=568900 RepID=A0A9N8H6C5_9STRA|nr:Glutathione gamma-glutamylcysteinyltransferase [Seminavis robusta]|eukprot:Sro142_g066230.1 Glutathione gamma-glutamylcysteinyltransferase (386) ;mRNA; f:56177-57334
MSNHHETTSLLRPFTGRPILMGLPGNGMTSDDATPRRERGSVMSKFAALAALALVLGCTVFTGTSFRFSVAKDTFFTRSDDVAYLEERIDLWEAWKQRGNLVEDRVYLHTRHYSPIEAKHEFPIYLNHSDAYAHLVADGHKGAFRNSADYFLYQQGLDAQVNQAFCAVAASVALLNSLRGILEELPQDPIYSPYPYATQTDIFNECTHTNVVRQDDTFQGILSAPFGVSLNSAVGLLQCNLNSESWDVQVTHVDPDKVSHNDMRQTMKAALRDPNSRVMVNYERTSAGQIGGGHFSPVGAYSTALDAFLIMDVAKYKYPNAWIPTEVLYQSLGTIDYCGQWAGPAAQALLPPALLHPATPADMEAAKRQLGCQPKHRGFIVVSKK